MTGVSVVSYATSATPSRVSMSDTRKIKLKKNIASLIISRCMQTKYDLAHPTREQVLTLEHEVEQRLQDGQISDTDICAMSAKLRRKLRSEAPRSESCPIESPNDSFKKRSLPPLQNAPHMMDDSSPSTAFEACSPMSDAMSCTSSLINNKRLAKSTKPVVVKRREMLMADASWHKHIEDDMERFKMEEKEKKMKYMNKMGRCKRSLDDQVQYNKSLKQAEADAERDFALREEARMAQWKVEEQHRAAKRKEAMQREKEFRDLQLMEERKLREQDREKAVQEDQVFKQRLEAEERRANEADKKKKDKCRELYKQQFIEFNKVELEYKKEEEERERQRDKEILSTYAKLLEKQEQSRADIMKRSEKKMPSNQYFKELVEVEMKRQEVNDKKVQEEVQRMELRKCEEDLARKEAAKRRAKEFVDVLGEQLKVKQDMKAKERAVELEFRKKQDEEVERCIQFELEQKRAKKEKAKKDLEALDKQVVEKHHRNMGLLEVGITRK
eukprot:TRINITY_DN399_c1_g1_i1.p1 TRINITY_DN399_c1_g1~~TRINITY_DN399_c1_g1_i1.p1  ORF type:complete len:517 (+),score=286.97 TRINITY_DN399_c1_g1_i1:53-1552(+)